MDDSEGGHMHDKNSDPLTFVEAAWAFRAACFRFLAVIAGQLRLSEQAERAGKVAIEAEVERWKTRDTVIK